MTAKILVVEDEKGSAIDLKNRLKTLGYSVPPPVFSGKEAVQKASENPPDLVLIDIQLRGDLDGVNVAKEIHDHLGIPIVYLMEDAVEEVLQDEKVIEPFYYVLKPYEERSLHLNIEKALYHHKMGRVWEKLYKH
jgi:CheY-like chemotaxis protein